MTFKEKLKKEHPDKINQNVKGGCLSCPKDYGYEPQEEKHEYCFYPKDGFPGANCEECWNREIPAETKIKDSGERRRFETGAVRDISEGKGRFDLLPLDILGTANQDNRLTNISNYQKTNDTTYLYAAMSAINYRMDYDLIARIARHFENGAKKYDENNWKQGIPCKCYIDSAVRHYFKWVLLEIDEDHEAAYYWNIMCCIWTHENIPEMQSYKKEGE